MAVGDFFGRVKSKVRSVYNNFFYDGSEAPTPPVQEDYYGAQEQPRNASWQGPSYGAQNAYPQQPYQQPAQQQPLYAPYQQAPAQQPYGVGYQQPYNVNEAQQPAYQPSAPQAQPRTRRAQQRSGKVVDFGAYQQGQAAEPPAQEQPAPQEQAAAPGGSLLSARVINARNMGDCRSAITLLRNGDAVLIVLENVTEPTEMRRLVDTLSGACYSLTATITKVSRYGVYLLAPQTLAVFADQATNAMNSAPAARPQARVPYQQGAAPAGQRMSYAPQQRMEQQPAPARQNNPYAGMPGFTQRSALPQEAPQNFYQRPMPQQAQATGFSAQPAAYGYAPDETPAVDQ